MCSKQTVHCDGQEDDHLALLSGMIDGPLQLPRDQGSEQLSDVHVARGSQRKNVGMELVPTRKLMIFAYDIHVLQKIGGAWSRFERQGPASTPGMV